MSPKPIFMTVHNISERYKLTEAEALELTKNLEPSGFYGRTDNFLYPRKDIEKELKKCRTA